MINILTIVSVFLYSQIYLKLGLRVGVVKKIEWG